MSWVVERWAKTPGLLHCFGDRNASLPSGVTTLRQVHGRRVHYAGDLDREGVEGDGLLTDRTGTSVGVWTADCVPVHLVAPAARVAAAVHSGWRGTVAGVVDEAIGQMCARWGVAPAAIEAALGPAIGGCCYEVGEEMRDQFAARYGTDGERNFERRDGRLFLDLREFLSGRLRQLGVGAVDRVGPCTACRVDVLCSYRRERSVGRQLSWIGWQ